MCWHNDHNRDPGRTFLGTMGVVLVGEGEFLFLQPPHVVHPCQLLYCLLDQLNNKRLKVQQHKHKHGLFLVRVFGGGNSVCPHSTMLDWNTRLVKGY